MLFLLCYFLYVCRICVSINVCENSKILNNIFEKSFGGSSCFVE